jgi:carbon-monoxide dehydrogenase medium subunit/xanthine dehydrogenase FAD-binding subunit
MKPFEYIVARSIQEATDVLATSGPDACILAGGTDLLIEFRRPMGRMPKVMVDISRIAELKGIEERNGNIVIKPLTTHAMLHHSLMLQKHSPLLSLAASWIGSPQIRNRGTIGGNIMNAATCADTIPPLIALGATVALQSKSSTRHMPLADLFVQPYHTKANAGELLTEIQFQPLPTNARSTFVKLGRRNALSISRLSVAAVLVWDELGKIINASIVPGAAFPTWRRVPEAEEMLLGEQPSERLFAAGGQKVSEVMIAATGWRWSTEYKEPVIGVLVRRALEECCLNIS